MPKPIPHLILVEERNQVEPALRIRTRDSVFCATAAAPVLGLETAGASPVFFDDLCSLDRRVYDVAEHQMKIRELADALDLLLRRQVRYCAENELSLARASAISLRHAMSELLVIAPALSEWVRTGDCGRASIPEPFTEELDETLDWDFDSPYARLLQALLPEVETYAWKAPASSSRPAQASRQEGRRLSDWVRSKPVAHAARALLRGRPGSAWRHFLIGVRPAPARVLMAAVTYELRPLADTLAARNGARIDLLRNEGGPLVPFFRSGALRKLNEAFSKARPEVLPEEADGLSHRLLPAEAFRWHGVDLRPVLGRRIDFFLRSRVPDLVNFHARCLRLLQAGGYDAVVVGNAATPERQVLLAAAKASGVRTIGSQHGGGYGATRNPIAEEQDLDNPRFDHFLAWGEGVRRYSEKHGFRKPRIWPVGSAWLDAHAGGGGDAIAYVPTLMLSHPRRRRAPGGGCPDHEFLRRQQRMLDLFRRYANHRFIFKPHPSDGRRNPLVWEWARVGPPNVELAIERSFEETLQQTRLIVIDIPYTTVLQAMASRVNVFTCWHDRELTWEPEALEALRTSGYHFDTFEEMLQAVEQYINNPERFPRKDAGPYLRMYGTLKEDGRSAERGAEAIMRILSGGSNAAAGI